MARVEVKVPDIGDFESVDVIELLVQVGDTIKVEQSLITVESDKASMEIPSSHAGVVKELKIAVGDKVSEGTLVLMRKFYAAHYLQLAEQQGTPPFALLRARPLCEWPAVPRYQSGDPASATSFVCR